MNVNEIFESIQGEGPFTGKPAVFVRLWGCIKPYCSFCDTKYAWSNKKKEAKGMDVSDIIKKVEKYKSKFVVITGGEPFAQEKVYYLINRLLGDGYKVQVETSGKAEILKNRFDDFMSDNLSIIMSPKQYNGRFKVFDNKTLDVADVYKFVVENKEELNNVIEFVRWNNIEKKRVFLMPKGATRKEQLKISQQVIKWCIDNGFNFSTRLHILIWDRKRKV